jgi:hypothetical protein
MKTLKAADDLLIDLVFWVGMLYLVMTVAEKLGFQLWDQLVAWVR